MNTWKELRGPSIRDVEVKCEQLRKLGDGKGSDRHCEALKHAIRVHLTSPLDFHRDPLIGLVQRLRKFI